MRHGRARIGWCAGVGCILAACAAALPPVEPLAGDLRHAIWSDVNSSVFLHNGDALAEEWLTAGSGGPAALDHHNRELRCRGGAKPYRCTFLLVRDGAAGRAPGDAPARLSCWALLDGAPPGDKWVVKHYPSEGWVHTQSTMSCRGSG